jgi:hypothetical protein
MTIVVPAWEVSRLLDLAQFEELRKVRERHASPNIQPEISC